MDLERLILPLYSNTGSLLVPRNEKATKEPVSKIGTTTSGIR